MYKKRAEMGVGTLIIFIALLLVAAVAAGVLIQTATSLQQKSLSTGQQAKSQISTNMRVVEVSATDGRQNVLKNFTMIGKLAPGSEPIKLNQTVLTFNTKDKTATLKYRDQGTLKNDNTGFNTYRDAELGELNESWYTLPDDLDNDQQDDYIKVYQGGSTGSAISLNLSTVGFINVSLSENITNASGSSVSMDDNLEFTKDGITYATLVISGTTNKNNTILANMTAKITPVEYFGRGYFSVEYLQKGADFVNGHLQRGDVIKFYFEAPEDVGEDEDVRINFIPKIGTPTLVKFSTPDVLSYERVYLYP